MPGARKNDGFVNEYLINARISKGYSVAELAKKVGITFASVMNYEKMKNLPNSEIAEKMAEVLGISAERLFPANVRESTQIINKYRRGYGEESIEDGRIFCCELSVLSRIPVEYKDELCLDELTKKVRYALSQLNCREREILKLHFGISDGSQYLDESQYSRKEIGNIIQRGPENVRRIMVGAFDKIRRYPVKYGNLQELVY